MGEDGERENDSRVPWSFDLKNRPWIQSLLILLLPTDSKERYIRLVKDSCFVFGVFFGQRVGVAQCLWLADIAVVGREQLAAP